MGRRKDYEIEPTTRPRTHNRFVRDCDQGWHFVLCWRGLQPSLAMTLDQLIQEGRKLQRPCVFLRPQGSGPIAAIWHDPNDDDEIRSIGDRCWLTVDARFVPNMPPSVTGFLSIFTNFEVGGRVEINSSWPQRGGIDLYAHQASVLPPIDAVFARGSEAVGDWIRSHGWEREDRYNDNFKGKDLVDEYERVWAREFPMCLDSDIHAVLGGWHPPLSYDDWHELIDEQLIVLTIRDAEPWIEAWRTRTGEFLVIPRVS
jgi:hypothetical protein